MYILEIEMKQSYLSKNQSYKDYYCGVIYGKHDFSMFSHNAKQFKNPNEAKKAYDSILKKDGILLRCSDSTEILGYVIIGEK